MLAPGRSRLSLAVAAALVIYLVAAISIARTRMPWCDEAWFANPGYNLSGLNPNVRAMSTDIIAPAPDDPKTVGLAQRTYWMPPLDFVVQAAWYRIWGFGLLQLRMLSVIWGAIELLALFVLVRQLTGSESIALLSFGLLSMDAIFLMRAADGRMDMMSLALGLSGLGAYVTLREIKLREAVLFGNSLVMLSGLTHPVGGTVSFLSIVLLMLYFDRSRFGWRHLFWMILPYLLGAVGWGVYIFQDPHIFLTQFGGNVSGRGGGILTPWLALKREILERYVPSFGVTFGEGLGVLRSAPHFKMLVLLGYCAGFGGVLLAVCVGRRRKLRALLVLAIVPLLFLSFFENSKQPTYLIYVIPFLVPLLAAWVVDLWNTSFSSTVVSRWLISTGIAIFVLVQLGSVARVILHDSYHQTYLPAVAFLKQNWKPDMVLMGPPELAFELGFDGAMIDDRRLGFYSGKRPDLVVVDADYGASFERFQQMRPEIYRHVAMTLVRYHEVFRNAGYTVFSRQ